MGKVDLRQKEQQFQELKARIQRLKAAERELNSIQLPEAIFTAEVGSIKAKLKLPAKAEEVEPELIALKRETAAYHSALETVNQAKEMIQQAKTFGCVVAEAESILAQATSAFERKDYERSRELSHKAREKAQELIPKRREELARKAAVQEALNSAKVAVDQARALGCVVAEAETVLHQAAAAVENGNYSQAGEYAQRAAILAANLRNASRPQIVLEFPQRGFQLGEWRQVELKVANRGTAHAEAVTIRFSQELEIMELPDVSRLAAGEEETALIEVRAREAGEIMVSAEVNCRDLAGKEYTEVISLRLSVEEKQAALPAEIVRALPQYSIIKKIGAGGFADVYHAKKLDGLEIALKIPRLDTSETANPRDFLREAELWRKLSHPNIVRVYEYQAKQYPWWIAMELMTGGSLRRRIGKLSLKETLEIAGKLAEALDYAHFQGVIHRDIKPENVLCDSQNTPKLTDWGLGKVLLEASQSFSGFKGTLAYSAPEQLSSDFGMPDRRTDIYQLGAVLYEMLTGQLPCGGELGRILSKLPPPPSQLVSRLPPEIDSIALRALAKRMDERFRDVYRFKEELERVAKNV